MESDQYLDWRDKFISSKHTQELIACIYTSERSPMEC